MTRNFQQEPIRPDLPDADISYYHHFYEENEANAIFDELLNTVPWQQDEIKVFGKTYPQPRLTALFGDDGLSYTYSNITMQPNPWTPLLQKLKKQVGIVCQTEFTTVLLNLYRDGKDSNGWHADNEKELGENPVIASLSFGAERFFSLKHNTISDAKHKILLENGSLLVMSGTTQHHWKHQVAKTAKPVGPRINLTFRTIR